VYSASGANHQPVGFTVVVRHGACQQWAACAQLLGASKHDGPVHSSGELRVFQSEQCMRVLLVALVVPASSAQVFKQADVISQSTAAARESPSVTAAQ
jgi:hypothetical protein